MTTPVSIVGGIPTDPDVKLLMEAFPGLVAGEKITYAVVSDLIHASAKSARFRTVTSRWRKILVQERNIRLRAQGGSFEVLTESDRLRENVRGYASALRKTRRTAEDTARIDSEKLQPQERVAKDHMLRLLRAQVDAGRAVQKEIATHLTPPPRQLPRTAPQN